MSSGSSRTSSLIYGHGTQTRFASKKNRPVRLHNEVESMPQGSSTHEVVSVHQTFQTSLGMTETERVKLCHLRNRMCHRFSKFILPILSGGLGPTLMRSFAHMSLSSTVFFASSHCSKYIPCCTGALKKARETSHTINAFFFGTTHWWCVKSAPAVPQLAELRQTILRCLILRTAWLPVCFVGTVTSRVP